MTERRPRPSGGQPRPAAGRARPGRGRRGRPASQQGEARAATLAAPAPRPRRRLTGRAAVLIVLLAVLTVSYASSLRAYLQQRAHITDLKADIAEKSESIRQLEREKRRWQDDAFLEQQARERFGFAYPGEVSYQVLGEDGKPLDGEGDTLHEPSEVLQAEPTAWWSTAWESVELAGNPPTSKPGPEVE